MITAGKLKPLPEDAPLILASTSPRRFYLLREAGIPFDVVAPGNVAEDSLPGEHAEDMVVRHARAKAGAVAPDYPGRLVLGADTVVVLDGEVYGKPKDDADARRMLGILQGRTHTVFTGLALLDAAGGREISDVEATEVSIAPLSPDKIAYYVETGEPADKAGAYAIQGRGSLLVERVDGDYFNVVGLPLFRLTKLFESLGYDVLR
ncbi:MAG: nucleoside triphosphate pyrophosphatase [Candidatus Zixiibacteriota bacterium]|jgi:septum formation protein